MRSVAIGLAWLLAMPLQAQPQFEALRRGDPGRLQYENSCASCHGKSGQGDGPLAAFLVTPPADLSLLVQRNGGVFPRQRVIETIDGRDTPWLGAHGSREMPIWGSVFHDRAEQAGAVGLRAERATKWRLSVLVNYLSRLQQQ